MTRPRSPGSPLLRFSRAEAWRRSSAGACLLGLLACGDGESRRETGFPDQARARGLDYVNRSGTPAKSIILEANGAGVAALDLGGDDDLDLVFAQGLDSLESLLRGPGADLEVFENDGRGHFRRAAGPGLAGWWTGLAAGDVDGDGDTDLVAGGFGGLRVLLQDERGRLVPGADLMPRAGALTPGSPREARHPPLWVSSVALFDADRDGNLDLYVGQYLELDPLAPTIGSVGKGALSLPCTWKGHPVFCGPRGLVPQPDRLLRGRGDGSFEEMTGEWLPAHQAGYTLAVTAFDADRDGDTDLYVASDSSANCLWINDGTGRFVDHAYAAGVALSQDGAPEAGMGAAAADVDRDGRPDLAVTNFSDEPTELFLAADVGFRNQTYRFGLLRETRKLLSWSVHLIDFDGDGWLELLTANGHVFPQADLEGTGTSYGQPATLFRLWPLEQRCERVLPRSESSIFIPAIGARGSAVGDFDGDGAPDVVLARIDAPAALGMNRTARARRLLVRCLGPSSPQAGRLRTPADGMGTRAIVVPRGADFALVAEVQTAVGYQSASSPWLSFGLDGADGYEELRILWPSGRMQELGAGSADRRIWVREGEGIVREEALP